jgi:hypothetical protein
MSKYTVQRPRHSGEIQRFHEQARVSDLPAAAAAHEAPKLLLSGSSVPCTLLLERAEGPEVSLSVNDLLHGGGTESSDQLVLQVYDAHVETLLFHIGPSEVGAEAGPLETAPEFVLLSRVIKTRQPEVEPLRAVEPQESSDGLRTSHRHDGDALGIKVPATAAGKGFERDLVADPLDEHDRRSGGDRRFVVECLHGSHDGRHCGLHPLPERAAVVEFVVRGCGASTAIVASSENEDNGSPYQEV